jgi:hypothetical protein
VPTVLRWGRYRAFFYSNERNEPPHVHVRADNKEAKFWLNDFAVAANAGFRAHELDAILRYLKLHRDMLLAAWNEHLGTRRW